jgi:hypothetical protein
MFWTATALLVAGCPTTPADVAGDCSAFVSRSASISLDLSKVKEWKASLGITDEVYQKLELLQGDYALRARNLCVDKAAFEKAGRMDEYFCRAERLDRSAEQLRVLDLALKSLSSEKDAQEKAGSIKNGLDYYFSKFATTGACSSPPPVKQLDELRGEVNSLRIVILELTDRVAQVERKTLKGQTLEQVASQIGYRELLPPSDALLPAVVSAIANVNGGFKVKSYLLISELYFRETLWLLDPKNGSSGLEQLPLNKRLASKPVLADEGLAKARERVRVQLSLVQYFSDRNASIALPLRKAAAISGRDERRSEVNRVIAQLEPKAKQFPSGSFLNFLGTLALANEENERAFKFYYAGVTEDPEHLPIYESLSYSMWRLNGDSRTARRYAANGFGLVQDLSLRWRRQREQSAATLTELRARNASIEPYAREVSAFYAMAEPSVTGYLNVMFERLGSSLAYYSALELTDREQAKRVIKDVVERRPENAKDADYVDTQGFVTLRFASTLDEVDEAIRTFQAAKKLADQKEQIDLIDLHLDTAQKIRQQSSRG